jgi:TolA-binding protein
MSSTSRHSVFLVLLAVFSTAIMSSKNKRVQKGKPQAATKTAASSTSSATSLGEARSKEHEEVNLGNIKDERRKASASGGGGPAKAQGPSISRGEAFVIATEGKLSSEIKKAISFYERTERTLPPKSSARSQMLERLVNLYLENAVYEANAEFRRYDQAYDAWSRAGGKGKSPQVDNRVSKGVWKQVAAKSAYVLKEFPRSKEADSLMFNQGIALQYLGQEKESAKIYTALIQKYPNSPKAGEAYFQLGDFFFGKQDFRNAISRYKEALKYRTSRGYGWSLFQLGWSYYNLAQYQIALDYWKKTVDVATRSKMQGSEQLKEESLKDMVLAWIEVRQVEEAIMYYKAHGGERYIGRFLNRLGEALIDIGKFKEAISVYKRFQSLFPNAPETPEAQKEIVALYYDTNSWDNLWKELERLPIMYGAGSSWAKANSEDQNLVNETDVMVRDRLLYYPKILHKGAQKDDDGGGYAQALRGYNLYLKYHKNSKEMPEVRYLMADILFAQKKYREAGRVYLGLTELGKEKAVIYDPISKKPNLIHQKSARYMLDSYGLDFEPEYKVLSKRTPDFDKPQKLSPSAENYVKACSLYLKFYKEDKKSTKECDIYVSTIYYRLGHRDFSKKLLFKVAQNYSNEKIGTEAVEFLIPLYGKDTKALVGIADNLLKIPAYQKGKLGDKLRDLKRGAEIDEINKISDAGKRAKALEDQAKRNPNSSDADRLTYNAAIDYVKAGMIPNALVAYQAVVTKYPKSEAYKDSLLQLGKLSDKRLEWPRATNYYLAFAQRYPKDDASRVVLGRVCELEGALGTERAPNLCMDLAKSEPAAAKNLIERMVIDAQYSRNYAKMQSLISQYLLKFKMTPSEQIITWNRLYSAANGQGALAKQAEQQMLDIYRRSKGNVDAEASRYVGGLVFANVNGIMARFAALKLQGGTVENLLKSIQTKAGMLPQIDKAFSEVLGVKDAYSGVAALHQQGLARELLSRDLENPPAITGASLEDVKKQLAGDANAIKAQSKEFYEKAARTVSEFAVYSEWAARSVSALSRINGRKVNYDDIAVEPDFIAVDIPGNIASAVLAKGE